MTLNYTKIPMNPEIIVKDTEDNTLKLTMHWESNVWVWRDNFKLILKWLTFPDEVIEKAFGKEE